MDSFFLFRARRACRVGGRRSSPAMLYIILHYMHGGTSDYILYRHVVTVVSCDLSSFFPCFDLFFSYFRASSVLDRPSSKVVRKVLVGTMSLFVFLGLSGLQPDAPETARARRERDSGDADLGPAGFIDSGCRGDSLVRGTCRDAVAWCGGESGEEVVRGNGFATSSSLHSVVSSASASPLSSPLSDEVGDQRDAGGKVVLLQRAEGRKVGAVDGMVWVGGVGVGGGGSGLWAVEYLSGWVVGGGWQ